MTKKKIDFPFTSLACVIIINDDVSIVQLHSRFPSKKKSKETKRATLYLTMQMIIYSAIFQK